ncbi:MAG: patatin-like phospholipase family protein [Bacteroidia bacterium]|nr:patatin-like phospholipase family protein [Bacteroidia bacterium]
MKKILSIDGGGIRGLLPITLLARLEEELNKPLREHFQLMAGTSTGGLIVLCLAHGLSAKEVQEFYLVKTRNIFKDNVLDDIKDGFGKSLGADYDQKNLERILHVIFGDTTLGNLKKKSNCNVLIPAFDISPEKEGNPVNFRPKVYNSVDENDSNEKLVDVACRTSAAPTYFPIREQHFIDGGVSINHPAMAALAFAINKNLKNGLGYNMHDIKMLSIGTGTANQNRISLKEIGDGDWGSLKWIKYLPDLITESNIQSSEYYVKQVLNYNDDVDKHYLRVQPQLENLIKIDTKDPKILEDLINSANKISIDNILSFLED